MKIVFVEPIGVNEEELENTKLHFELQGHEFDYFTDRNENYIEIIERAKYADILTVSNIPISSQVINSLPNLKLINVAFTGVDHIDLEACRNRKIAVCNAAGYSTTAVSELTIGLAVSLLRNILVMDTQTRIPAGRNNYNGTELKGKTVGIVGTGQIGMTTAKLFSAFGCKIIAWSRTQRESDFIKYVSLDELFRCSDIISLHIPSTEETAKLINEELLSEMKTSSVIINTARGQVIDYLALSQMLISGRIAGAAIDIYETEPPIPENHPLLSAPNTILLPHIAYATKEAMLKRFEIAKSNIEFFLNGKVQNRIL